MQRTTFAPDQAAPGRPRLARAREGSGGTRVAIVLPGLRAGGSERVASLLSGGLAEAGMTVSLVTFEGPDEPPYYAIDPRVGLHALDVPARPGRLPAAVRQVGRRVAALRRVLDRISPDVTVSFLTKTNVVTLLAAPRSLPVIVSERNNPDAQRFGRLWETARAHLYPRAYAFVTMTHGAASFYPPHQRPRTTIIRNPVAVRALSGSPAGKRVLAAVGRLDPQKGFDLLIDAFAAVADRHPDWTLVIWGEGPLRAALEAQRDRLGLAARVRLPGLSPTPGAWIEDAEAFVLSSRFEGWPNALAEALAARLPVAAFACPHGPQEMIEDGVNGLLAAPESREALAEALDHLLGDETLRARLSAGCRTFADGLTVEAIVNEWRTLIEGAVSERPRPAR